MGQISEWAKAGGRFVSDSLRPVRRWNALVSWTGLGLIVTLSSWIAARSAFGTTRAVAGGLTLVAILFLLQGARLEHLLHGGASFGSLHPADTEGDVVKGNAVVRLRLHNSGRRGQFRATATWLDSESRDIGYSPWDLTWAKGGTSSEIARVSSDYLLPFQVTRNHGGNHILYQHPQSPSETPKFKSVEENQPRIAIRIMREKPEAESCWIVGFEMIKDSVVQPRVIEQVESAWEPRERGN